LYWRDPGGSVHSYGSIGGGRLEAHSTEIARFLLEAGAGAGGPAPRGRRRVERFTLGASLGQCCGGVVQMYWERFDELSQAQGLLHPGLLHPGAIGGAGEQLRYCALDGSDRECLLAPDQVEARGLPPPAFEGRAGLIKSGSNAYFVERMADEAVALWLYGAGHVGRALVHVLAELPFRITWVDSRPAMLAQAMANLPARQRDQIAPCADDDPDRICATAPSHAWHLVMTHCHDQDLRICEALLSGGRFGFLGLIGSQTKAARFRRRLRDKGYRPDLIARLVCPIGIDGIDDKQPAAIAIAVAAQLLQQRALGPRPAPAPAPALAGCAPHG
jgi:xanthine dehydrogenase accessory factor